MRYGPPNSNLLGVGILAILLSLWACSGPSPASSTTAAAAPTSAAADAASSTLDPAAVEAHVGDGHGAENGDGFGADRIGALSPVPDGPPRVRRGTLRRTLLLSGELRAVHGRAILVPPTPSWDSQIRFMVEDGTLVEEGDRLVELDTSEVANQLNDAETAVQRAINELASKRAEVDGKRAEKQLALDKARIELAKAEIDARIPEDVQSQRQFQQRQLAWEQARVQFEKATADVDSYAAASEAELEVLRIDLEKARRELAQAQRAIDTMVLRAPQSGIVVVSINYREGRKFQEGDSAYVGAEVMSIPDLSQMMVEARLSDVDDGELTPGMRAICTLDAYPDLRLRGVVRSIGPVAQELNYRSMQRYFRVIVDLEESDPERMLPGMSVQVEVETLRLDDALLVPRSALDWADGEARLRVGADAAGGPVPVRLGPCNAFECVLEEGPPEGTWLAER